MFLSFSWNRWPRPICANSAITLLPLLPKSIFLTLALLVNGVKPSLGCLLETQLTHAKLASHFGDSLLIPLFGHKNPCINDFIAL